MRGVLRRLGVRKSIYLVAVFCIVAQSLSTPTARALEGDATFSHAQSQVPTNGSPDGETKLDTAFAFVWSAAKEGQAQHYQLRISPDESQVGEAPDSSSAWYSSNLLKASMPAGEIPALEDGLWYWQVRSIDDAANKGDWSEVWTVMIDVKAPIIHVDTPLSGELFGGREIPLSAKVADTSDLTSIIAELDDQDITSQLQQARNGGEVTLQKTWQPGEIADGSHAIRIVAEDRYGHRSEITRSFAVDTTPPQITTPIEEGQLLKGLVTLDLMAHEMGTYAIRVTGEDGELLAQDDTEQQTENASAHSRVWNTWRAANGGYMVTFTGRDAAGNESSITRYVKVENVINTGIITVKDPLLEELSATLNQPLSTPYPVAPPRISSGVDTPVASDAARSYDEHLGSIPDFAPMAATENGWRLFGILWYWWMLGGLLLASGVNFAWRLVRAPIQQIPDSA